jgi:hypothetical protein
MVRYSTIFCSSRIAGYLHGYPAMSFLSNQVSSNKYSRSMLFHGNVFNQSRIIVPSLLVCPIIKKPMIPSVTADHSGPDTQENGKVLLFSWMSLSGCALRSNFPLTSRMLNDRNSSMGEPGCSLFVVSGYPNRCLHHTIAYTLCPAPQ